MQLGQVYISDKRFHFFPFAVLTLWHPWPSMRNILVVEWFLHCEMLAANKCFTMLANLLFSVFNMSNTSVTWDRVMASRDGLTPGLVDFTGWRRHVFVTWSDPRGPTYMESIDATLWCLWVGGASPLIGAERVGGLPPRLPDAPRSAPDGFKVTWD